MSVWESARRLVTSAATALWVTILICAVGYVRRCPTGKYKEAGEKSLREAAKILAFARASAKGWWVADSQRHCLMRECQTTG